MRAGDIPGPFVDFWQAGQTYWKLVPFFSAFASFASNVTGSVAVPLFCCLQLLSACLSVLLSVPSSSLRCFACGGASCRWAISWSLFCFRSTLAAQRSAVSPTALSLPLLSSRLPRTPAGPSVVISLPFSCLRCFAFGSASCVWKLSCSLVRFRSAMASQTSAMARAAFSSAALLATFACVAATRCTALLMLPRGMGQFQQLLQTWSPLQEPCCASHGLKANAACFTWHVLHLDQLHKDVYIYMSTVCAHSFLRLERGSAAPGR